MTEKIAGILSLTNHELYVVTARHEGSDYGQIATWVMPATLVPDRPRVVVALSVCNATQGAVEASGRFTLQMLSEEQVDLVPLFGGQSSRDVDKFAGLAVERSPSGLPLLPGTCGWMECRILAPMDAGDRIVTLASVEAGAVVEGRTPLRKQSAFARLDPETRAALERKQREDGVRDRTLMKHDFPPLP